MNVRNKLLHIGVLIVSAVVLFQGLWLPSTTGLAFDSPLLTPRPGPTPTAVPVPRCHALAMAHVARERGIPMEKLIAGSYVSNENGEWTSGGKEEWFEFPLIQRRACFVKVSVKDSDTVYGVALDEKGQVVDLEALRALEREAGRAKCGKFDPALCARMPALADDELVEVAIWLTDIDAEAIYDAVAVNYPASLQPEKGLSFDTGHPSYEKAFREAEERMIRAYKEREEPVLAFLESKAFKASYASTTAPIVFAELAKDTISALAAREDVVGIYLLEGHFKDAMHSIAPTIRVPQVWDEGYTGNGVRVAVVEDDPVDFGNQYLDHANGGIGPPEFAWYSDSMLHPTLTAGVIAMKDHPLYQGVAPDVTLYSADAGSYTPQSNIADAGDWAINSPNYVDVLNLSFGNSEPPLDFWSRYFDHVVWLHRRTVVAACNEGDFPPPSMGNPNSGYNVLTVGGFDDQDSSNWSDDEMSDFSSYEGPGSRDKPEVVAVADRICTTDLSMDDVGCQDSFGNPYVGTSFAAPQVSGLAALLMQKTNQKRKPELMKAIIMASAVHNIEGNSRLSDQDGAGGIDAALAYAVADHGRYGVADEGWYDYDTVYSSDFDSNGYLHYYVPASRGEKVRVVLAYNSHPESTDPYNNDQLYSDLDLYVRRPSGTQIAASSSYVNNFEIVEFIADETGAYNVRVKKYSWNTTYEYIGIAWVKNATYLPDLRNKDGWTSEFYVRNDGAEPRNVTIHYFDTNGDPTPKVSDTCYLTPNQSCWIPVNRDNRIPAGTIGSAIVSGGENVSVIVESEGGVHDERTNYSGILPGGLGSLGWEQAGPILYAPTIKRQYYGRSSTIYVVNAGSEATIVDVYYYDDNGNARWGGYYNLPPNEQIPIVPSGSGTGCGSSGTICSAKLVADNGQPLAGVVREYNDADDKAVTTHNLFSVGNSPIHFPVVKYDYYDMSTGLRIQNVGGSGSWVTVYFYPREGEGGGSCYLSDYVPSFAASTFFDSNCPGNDFVGSAVVVANQPLVGMANEVGLGQKKAYSSYQNGSRTVLGPLVYHNYGSWTAGIAVQNISFYEVTVDLEYYDTDGDWVGHQLNQTIGGKRMDFFFAPQTGFKGSVLITADEDIVAVVNVVNTAGGGDAEAIYNASNR